MRDNSITVIIILSMAFTVALTLAAYLGGYREGFNAGHKCDGHGTTINGKALYLSSSDERPMLASAKGAK